MATGGFRDNPNAEPFKDAFRYVVADKLFVHSSSSNCKVYSNKILLNIKDIAMTKYKKPLPSEVKMVPAMGIAMIIKPSLSLPIQNVATYLASHILRKVPVDDCQNCANQLVLPKLLPAYQDLSMYEFLGNETYQEAGCLTYPTPSMVISVEKNVLLIL